MAKIVFSKFSGQAPKGREIKSIVGEEYLSNYEERLQMYTEIAHQNHKARIKAEEVILLEKAKQEDDKLDENLIESKVVEKVQREDGLWNFVKPDRTFLCEEWFKCAYNFSEGFALVQREDGLWNFLKPDGTFPSTKWFESTEHFKEGFAVVQRADGLWNFLKPDGTFLSAEWFKYAWSFSEGIAKVQRADGLQNFLKPDGTFLSAEWFKNVRHFYKGFAEVQRSDGWYKLITDETLHKEKEDGE